MKLEVWFGYRLGYVKKVWKYKYAFRNSASKHKSLGMMDRVCFWKKGTFFFCQFLCSSSSPSGPAPHHPPPPPTTTPPLLLEALDLQPQGHSLAGAAQVLIGHGAKHPGILLIHPSQAEDPRAEAVGWTSRPGAGWTWPPLQSCCQWSRRDHQQWPLELHEIVHLAWATEELILPWPADNIQQHSTLGIQGRVLVGLTTENVMRGLVDKAQLQQGLPRDDNLYLIIGGRDAEEDGDGGGRRRKVAQWWRRWRKMMGGEGNIVEWQESNSYILLYCSYVGNHTTC